MLSQSQRAAILEMHAQKQSSRMIARLLKVSRWSVREVVRLNTTDVPALERAEICEPFRQQIIELLPRCKGNLVRVQEELAASGATLSYSALTAFCRRHGIGQAPIVASGRYTYPPGAEMQHDTSPHKVEVAGKLCKAQTASVVLCYRNYLKLHIVPKWGQHALSAMKSVEVEGWLRNLKKVNGQPASPGTRTKIRNLLSALYSHAIRYEWASRNPITAVRTSAKRLRVPDILAPEEFQALLLELSHRERVMVMLDGTTGLRRGELIALRWRDIDFELMQANVTHSVWRNVEGDAKTEASRKPVPLHSLVIEELRKWKLVTLYRTKDDFLFPSIAKNGAQPLTPDMILKRHIRPALDRIGVKKRIGWHSFRHGLATMLRQKGVDLKTAQEMLRHANSRITADIYQQCVGEEKRHAQDLVFRGLLEGSQTQHPSAPLST
jgi:integrase